MADGADQGRSCASANAAEPAPGSIVGEPGEGAVAWEGRLEWSIGAPVEAVWEVTGDFLGMERWAPSIVSRSELLEGVAGEAGCVRRVEGPPSSTVLGDCPSSTERLLALDPAAHTMTYVVLSSTAPSLVGLTATFHLLPEPSHPASASTRILWSYLIPPIPGLQEDVFHQLAKPIYDLAISDLKKTMSLD